MSKVCKKCLTEKPLGLFRKSKRSGDGHAHWCSSCADIYMAEYREKNKAKIARKTKQYRQENAKSVKAAKREYYIKNKDEINAKNREARRKNADRYKLTVKKYKEDNKGAVLLSAKMRKKKIRNATPLWVGEVQRFVMAEIYELNNMRSKCLNIKYNVDHIVPIVSDKVCGLHVPENMQIITAQENRRKSNKWDVAYAE